jgi:hypothetical protein
VIDGAAHVAVDVTDLESAQAFSTPPGSPARS